jgi:hypothetical protein
VVRGLHCLFRADIAADVFMILIIKELNNRKFIAHGLAPASTAVAYTPIARQTMAPNGERSLRYVHVMKAIAAHMPQTAIPVPMFIV